VIEEYYLPRIAELEQQAKGWLGLERGPLRRATIGHDEWLRWRLESECLHYYLQISEREGLAYFEERFLDARRNSHLLRMQFLLNEVETAGYADVGDTLELRRAESLRLNQQVDRARSICENALARPTLSPQNRASAHVTLGLIAAAVDPVQAEAHYQQAIDLARESGNTQLLSAVHNNLGQLYRATGRLQQAADHLQQAIEYAKQIPNWPLVASATNNLAYVYRQWGNLPRADALCRVALAQRKQLGLERELAYSSLNKAEIDRDKGDLESAERYNKLALRSFDKLDERGGQALAYESLANIHRHIGQFQSSETYIQEGLRLAGQLNDDRLRARLYNVYGREQRDHAMHALELGEAQEAAELLQRSLRYQELGLELAGQYGDPWLTTRGRYELALTYFLGHLRPTAEINALLDEVWDDAVCLEYTLIQGYVQEVRGEIALREGEYGRAAHQLGQATLTMAQLTSRESTRFFDRISDYLLATDRTPENALTLAQGILDVIGSVGAGGGPLQPLRALCQQIIELQG
jgi:tetratricopeptide (TPR) repeat protein